jgi:hypothetical protein
MPKKEEMKMDYENDLFVTKDFYFVCFIKTKGVKIKKKKIKMLHLYKVE